MKRILLVLAGYALYRWWTKPLPEPEEPPIALPQRKRRPASRQATN